ncbi:uncharacterized protein LOC112569483 [Pomacea canaliculata]|uniref:uncharacterized protein LOC112569483 n=1 Tax=Pomacea canaliculata TaxID=400727 RepID=UPI000D7264A5|nr:uncharacterized protein LOC112569483 [Pomacea canaliculata]XP_025103074.1 uncharacterized protein LOC112569483 [Pomacea canaliculata]
MVHLKKAAVCLLFFHLMSIKASQPAYGKCRYGCNGHRYDQLKGNWGAWGAWGAWEVCSATCGKGVTTRRRTCSPVGAKCHGDKTNSTDCLLTSCCVPRDGSWGDWSDWSTCSSSCGGGSRTRSRKCNEPNSCGQPCHEKSNETTTCNVQACPRAPVVPSITTNPRTSRFSAGVNVTLTCRSQDLGFPPATLTWDTARQETRTTRVNDQRIQLQLLNLSVEDDEVSVKCWASNMVSRKEKSVVLRVDQNASYGDCRASVSSSPWQVTGYCDITKVFSSNNQYECRWYEIKGRDTNNIPSSFNLSLITPGRKLQRGKCGFQTKIPHDFPEGRDVSRELKYQMYFNPGGTWSPIINVTVAFPKTPTLTCPADVIMEGSRINCTCNTSNVGEPQGGLLLFYNDRLEDTGQYGQQVIFLSRDISREDNNARVSCLLHWARNMFADRVWTLRVMYPPEMPSLLVDNQTTVNYTTNVNNSVDFTCTVSPGNVQSLELLKVTRNGSQIVQGRSTSSLSFRIEEARCADSGIYYCRAGNTLGQTNSTSVHLNLLCSPEWASDTLATTTELKVTEGLEGQTTFEVMASPVPTIDGFISHQEDSNSSAQEKPVRSDLFTGKCEQKTPDLHLATCTVYVTQATPTDTGLYSVHVSNSMGAMNVTFELRVIACRDNLTDCPSLARGCGEHFVQELCWKTCSGCRKQTSNHTSKEYPFLSCYNKTI